MSRFRSCPVTQNTNKKFTEMTIGHLKTVVQPTPETSFIKYVSDNGKYHAWCSYYKQIIAYNVAGEISGLGFRFVALMMEAVRTSETLVYFNETTRRYIPDSYLPLTMQQLIFSRFSLLPCR
jgi:hypothetical protein